MPRDIVVTEEQLDTTQVEVADELVDVPEADPTVQTVPDEEFWRCPQAARKTMTTHPLVPVPKGRGGCYVKRGGKLYPS